MTANDRKWLAAEARLKLARSKADAALGKAMFPGRVVRIRRGRGIITAQITSVHFLGRSVTIRNLKTHREYSIDCFWLTPEFGADLS